MDSLAVRDYGGDESLAMAVLTGGIDEAYAAEIVAGRRAIAALAYYANERNYTDEGIVIGRGGPPSTVGGFVQEAWFEPDMGDRARAALAGEADAGKGEGDGNE